MRTYRALERLKQFTTTSCVGAFTLSSMGRRPLKRGQRAASSSKAANESIKKPAASSVAFKRRRAPAAINDNAPSASEPAAAALIAPITDTLHHEPVEGRRVRRPTAKWAQQAQDKTENLSGQYNGQTTFEYI